jgi:hypothetical protein
MRPLGHIVAVAPVVLVLGNCQPRASTELQGNAAEPLAESDVGSDASGPSASAVFSRIFPGSGSSPPSPKAIVVGPDGDIWVAGTFTSNVDFGDVTLTSAGAADVFVARLDATARPRWATRVDGAGFTGLAVDADGNTLVAVADELVKLGPAGEHLWQKSVLPIVVTTAM